MTAGLRPCPFCGSEAVMVKVFSQGFSPRCQGEARCHLQVLPFPAYPTREEAASAWNRRAVDAPALLDLADRIGRGEHYKMTRTELADEVRRLAGGEGA